MKTKTNRLLSLLLCCAMLLGLLPLMSITVFAAEPGISLSGADSDKSGTGWSYTASSQTLTLNNYDGGYIQGSGFGTLNLVLEGTSTITVDDANAKGIALGNNQNLNISGSGSLTINATGGSNLIYGIECNKFIMTSGTVTINANSSKMVYGVNANDSLSVTGGKLTANITGTSDGRGLYCKAGKLTVDSGAEVDVTVTNNGSNSMYGIYNEAYTASVTDNGDIELAGTVTITRDSGSTGSGMVYGIANGGSNSNTDGVISITGGSVTVMNARYGIIAFTKGHDTAFADVDISGGTVNVTSTTSDSLGIVSWNNGVTISGGTVTAGTVSSALRLFNQDSANKTGLVKITGDAKVSLTSTNYKALIVDGDESNTSTRVHQINLTSGGSVTVKSTSSDEIYYTYPVQGYFNLGSSTKITEGSFPSTPDGTNAGGGKLFQSDNSTNQVVVAYSTPAPVTAPTSIVIAYSAENRVGLNSSTGYYLVNGAAAASGTLGSDGCTAYYNESTGTLYLNGFNGGAIYVYGSNNKKLTIDLTGTNYASTLDNGSGNGCTFEITSSTNGKLIIDSTKESGTIIGINTGSTSSDTTGSVILSGSADVSVTLQHSGEENINNYAYAIYANEGIEIKDSASFTAKLKTKTAGPDRANGLYLTTKASGSKIVINTTGNVSIDTSEDTANYSAPIYNSSSAGEVKLQNVGKMTLKYKKYGTYGKDSYPDVTYATEDFTKNSVEEANIITTTYEAAAAAYTVTVQNDGNGSGSATPVTAAAGTEITLSATANSGYHFKEWQVVSGSVTITGNKFTMPASNVTVKAIFEADASETYSVTINAGANMTLSSGNANQSGLSGAMTDTVYTAADGYYFPTDYAVAAVNGITVTRNSYTQITVSGTPTANTTITLTATTAKTKEATPAATFDAQGPDFGNLMNWPTGMKYSVDGGITWTENTSSYNYKVIYNVSADKDIKVYKPASDPNTKLDSDIQTIDVTKAATPTGVIGVACTTSANNNGKLQNVTTAMQYKKSDASGWTDCGGTEVTGLANGTYFVRVKYSGTALASESVEVEIASYATTDITSVAISGLKTPVEGESATDASYQAITLASGAEYQLYELVWLDKDSNAASTFTAEAKYYARIILEPVSSVYQFTSTTTATYGGTAVASDKISLGSDGRLTVTVEFTVSHTLAEIIKPEALKSPADCTHDAVYYKSCACGTISSTETFTATGTALGHTFGNWSVTKAATETEKGEMRRICSVCGYIQTMEILPIGHTHSYGAEWKSDSNTHWHECDCGGKTDVGTHQSEIINSKPATKTESGYTGDTVCKICGYQIARGTVIPATGSTHSHAYGDWKSDSANHWKECECGDKSQNSAHSFVWVVDKQATDTAVGSKHEECSVCGYARAAVEIPATGASTTTTPPDTEPTPVTTTTPPESQTQPLPEPQPGDDEEKGSGAVWIAIGIIAGLGVAGGAGAVVYVKKKKEHAE